MLEECELCCEPAADTVVCEFGHRICQACRGNTCPFCHPLDYIKLEEHAADADAALAPEQQQPEAGPLLPNGALQHGRSAVVLTVVGNLALGAASIKTALSVIFPIEPVPQWAAWDDPHVEHWLLEGAVGWLVLYGAMRFCCNLAFSPLELLLCAR